MTDKPPKTAATHPGEILDYYIQELGYALTSTFGDGPFVRMMTVVKAGQVGDFACYQRIILGSPTAETAKMVAMHGNKLTERNAAGVFGTDALAAFGVYRK